MFPSCGLARCFHCPSLRKCYEIRQRKIGFYLINFFLLVKMSILISRVQSFYKSDAGLTLGSHLSRQDSISISPLSRFASVPLNLFSAIWAPIQHRCSGIYPPSQYWFSSLLEELKMHCSFFSGVISLVWEDPEVFRDGWSNSFSLFRI